MHSKMRKIKRKWYTGVRDRRGGFCCKQYVKFAANPVCCRTCLRGSNFLLLRGGFNLSKSPLRRTLIGFPVASETNCKEETRLRKKKSALCWHFKGRNNFPVYSVEVWQWLYNCKDLTTEYADRIVKKTKKKWNCMSWLQFPLEANTFLADLKMGQYKNNTRLVHWHWIFGLRKGLGYIQCCIWWAGLRIHNMQIAYWTMLHDFMIGQFPPVPALQA